ncbi:MAG: transcription termination factor NusA [Planctomycetota bacterium]
MAGSPELVRIIEAMAREKDLEKEVLFEGLETAMIAAARKKFDDAIELEISVDRESGEIIGYQDGKLIETAALGRIAAQTAKQVMIQKIREAEQDNVFQEYEGRRGELVTGTVQRFEGENVIVDLQKAEAILPRHERVRTETHNPGDRVRTVIADVRKVGHRVRIVLSRTHPDLIRRLFELEIPEISDHTIEIKGLAREPGFRTKLAVVSYDSKVDCVGACVGIRGSRIRNIIDELNGEKIDIIRWSESPEILIMNALKPAEILSITLDDDTGEAVVTVSEDQLSLAIGKRGQNVRLAARLTGWDVRITSPTGEPRSRPGGEGASELSDNEKRLLDQFRSGETATAVPVEADTRTLEEHDPLLEMAKHAMSRDSEEKIESDDDAMTRATAQVHAEDEAAAGGDDEKPREGGED